MSSKRNLGFFIKSCKHKQISAFNDILENYPQLNTKEIKTTKDSISLYDYVFGLYKLSSYLYIKRCLHSIFDKPGSTSVVLSPTHVSETKKKERFQYDILHSRPELKNIPEFQSAVRKREKDLLELKERILSDSEKFIESTLAKQPTKLKPKVLVDLELNESVSESQLSAVPVTEVSEVTIVTEQPSVLGNLDNSSSNLISRSYRTYENVQSQLYVYKMKPLAVSDTTLGYLNYYSNSASLILLGYNPILNSKLIVNRIRARMSLVELNNQWHIVFKNSLVEKLINFLLRDGLKTKAESLVFNMFIFIKYVYHKKPTRLLLQGISNILPCMETLPYRVGKGLKLIPKFIHVRRRMYLAFKWLDQNTKYKDSKQSKNLNVMDKKPYYEKLALELLASSHKKSRSFLRMVELHSMVYENRINSNLARRFSSKRRRRRIIKVRKRRFIYTNS